MTDYQTKINGSRSDTEENPYILPVIVRNRIAVYSSKEKLICSNSDYVVRFDFDAEWNAFSAKTAQFRYFDQNGCSVTQSVIFEGEDCPVPIIPCGETVYVGVYAGNLRTSTEAAIPCWPSALSFGGTPAPESEDIYNVIMEKLNSVLHITADKITPQMFGAVGDGITDDTDAFLALDGKNAYIPAGEYRVSKCVFRKNTVLRGSGVGKTVIRQLPDTKSDMFVFEDADSSCLTDLSLYGAENDASAETDTGLSTYCALLKIVYTENSSTETFNHSVFHNISICRAPYVGLMLAGDGSSTADPNYYNRSVTKPIPCLSHFSISQCGSWGMVDESRGNLFTSFVISENGLGGMLLSHAASNYYVNFTVKGATSTAGGDAIQKSLVCMNACTDIQAVNFNAITDCSAGITLNSSNFIFADGTVTRSGSNPPSDNEVGLCLTDVQNSQFRLSFQPSSLPFSKSVKIGESCEHVAVWVHGFSGTNAENLCPESCFIESPSELIKETLRYTPMVLTGIQKSAARGNIGAANAIAVSAAGENIAVEDGAAQSLLGLSVYGRSVLGGAPDPYVIPPAAIQTLGNDGSLVLSVGESSMSVAVSKGLPGIPVESNGNYVDSAGQAWVSDEIDFSRGVYIKRIGRVAFGNGAEFSYNGLMHQFTVSLSELGAPFGKRLAPCLCNVFPSTTVDPLFGNAPAPSISVNGSMITIHSFFPDNGEQLNSMFAEYFANGTPAELLYQLAEPVETALSHEQMAAFRNLFVSGCECVITTDEGAWLAVEYAADTKKYVDTHGGSGGGITQETDPTVPAWAKEPEKPVYTAKEVGARPDTWMPSASDVGALPSDTKIPAKTSDLNNNSGFITKLVKDLVNYYTTDQTYNKDEVNDLVTTIPKFSISVVSALPSVGISETTVYLVKSGTGGDLYTEYIFVNGAWEILGSQRVDLTGYATETWVNTQLSKYLLEADLTIAVNLALAKAKESGEFDGEDGKSAYAYAKDGGYTGTEAEFAEKLAFLMGYSVFGYVDENNNIVVKGNLADGTYTVKYEMEDGSTVDIGDLVLDSNVYYSITNNLTNCTNSNGDAKVIGGQSYAATITAYDGYELSSVSVTMGGNAVAVTDGVINIAEVMGNIVITAVADEVVTEEPTNLFNPDAAGFILNGRCSSSGADRADSNGYFVSNYIDVQNGDTVYIKNATVSNGTSAFTGMKLTDGSTIGLFPNNSDSITGYNETGSVTQFTINHAKADYIRICMVISSGTALSLSDVTSKGIIITVNEPLS